MILLILILVTGLGLVFVSKYNFTPVTVNFGSFAITNIPLFYVIVGSVVFGLIISYLVHLATSVSTYFAMRGKNKQLQKEKEDVLELTKRVHQLEIENEKIKHEPVVENDDKNAL
jgi:uncharacterized integral membrane protein